jgi:NAD(P)-dependent dehydrogenase (short-subunit alcohol dehydrogenase family)
VLIVGGESGIGLATAVTLARGGYDIGFTWHVGAERAQAAQREIESHGAVAAAAELDLTHTAQIVPTIEALTQRLGGLDAFVNNAGTGHATPILELDLDTWRQVLEVDLTGAFVGMQAAARIMVAAGTPGRMVAITSVHEHVPLGGAAAYCAAKGGLGQLVAVMALELAGRGITVNAVAPGEIATAMTGAEDVAAGELSRPGIPTGRPGGAHEVARAVAFLLEPDSAYITGHSLVVDGGMLLMAAEANRMAGG